MATIREANRELAAARRLYAAGHHQKATLRAKQAFDMYRQIRLAAEQALAEQLSPVVEGMEGVNELLKAIKAEVAPDHEVVTDPETIRNTMHEE